ncbi:MAG: NAD-dependent epimerase/dehydratase family protein [Chloroflexota bacterium]
MANVLVTGGAGFIGSHLVDGLLAAGHQVRVVDALVGQVHGEVERPAHLAIDAELIHADVADTERWAHLLDRTDVLYHLAAEVGVGQSMYEIRRYTRGNTMATADLLETLIGRRGNVRKLIVASSMSIYGEGPYQCAENGRVYPTLRPEAQLKMRDWELHCPACSQPVSPLPTDEAKPLAPTSIYAINKRDQEEMCLAIGNAYGIPTVALRFFNVYGPRQALSNPYTGVAAIFGSRLLNRRPPVIFEDGLQTRDFVHVSDIVQALMLAMEKPEADYGVFNVGTGRRLSVRDVAEHLAGAMGLSIEPEITGQFRAGDIRHCYADITKIQSALGFIPRVRFEDGVRELVEWVAKQSDVNDGVDVARAQLERLGLAG